jgi:hypothetical protein
VYVRLRKVKNEMPMGAAIAASGAMLESPSTCSSAPSCSTKKTGVLEVAEQD